MTTETQSTRAGDGNFAQNWEGAEEWMPLAWELCANECGEEACTELIWEGGPIPEPWGDRWLKYEDQAKEMIAMVRKHVPAWQPIETAPKDGREMFVVRAFGIDPTGREPRGNYTSDAYAVFLGANGSFVRWPHIWPPTHWMPLPAAPGFQAPVTAQGEQP